MDAKGIARALRSQLQHLGLEVTHAQALELVAKTSGAKDWNLLSAKTQASNEAQSSAAPCGWFCPKCGQSGTVSVQSSAFVEQGTGNEDGYLYEGDCDHLVCSACDYQFLDWQSAWPSYSGIPGYVILVRQVYTSWTAALYPLGRMLAILNEHNCPSKYLSPAEGIDAYGIMQALSKEVIEGGSNEEMVEYLLGYGLECEHSASGLTLNDAVKHLVSHLPKNIDDQVLNRAIGIC